MNVAIDPPLIISFGVKNSFPFLFWSDRQHKFGNEDTGSIWEDVVAMQADIA